MNKFLQILFAIIFSVFIFTLVVLSYQNFYLGAPGSPDVLVLVSSVKNLLNNGYLYHMEELNCDPLFKGFSLFSPRGFIILDNCFSVHGLKGHLFIYQSVLFSLINPILFFLINPLLFGLSVFFFKKLTNLFFKENISLVVTFLYAVFPPILFWSILPYTNIGAFSFYVISLYFFFELFLHNKKVSLYLFFIFFAGAIFSRYEYILFYIPLFFYAFPDRSKRYFWQILIFFFFVVLILLVANNLIYGNFLYTFLDHPGSVQTPMIDRQPWSFLAFSLLLRNYFIGFILPIFPIVLLSLLLFFIARPMQKEKTIFFFIFLIGSFYFIYGNYNLVDLSQAAIGASYSRYLLVAYFSLVFIMGFYLQDFYSRARFFSALICGLMILLFFIFSMGLVIDSKYGLLGKPDSFRDSQKKFYEFKKSLLDGVPEGSIILTKYQDKYVFPENVPLQYLNIPSNERSQKISQIIKSLLNRGYLVYITNEFSTEAELRDLNLSSNGLSLIKQSEYIYRIELSLEDEK